MTISQKNLYRIIDVNFNRAKEGLRVCEDVSRYILNDKPITLAAKKLRHQLTQIISPLKLLELLAARRIESDAGRGSIPLELKRKKIADIFWANAQRAKESIRVLEEFMKLVDQTSAQKLKLLRYKFYALEKRVAQKI